MRWREGGASFTGSASSGAAPRAHAEADERPRDGLRQQGASADMGHVTSGRLGRGARHEMGLGSSYILDGQRGASSLDAVGDF